MKPALLRASVAIALLLAGCATQAVTPLTLPLQERLRNPWVAERYWSELTEHMADAIRRKDPMTKDPVKAAILEGERVRALERLAQARAMQTRGVSGQMITPDFNEDVHGHALLVDGVLYFDTTFLTYPGPSIHVFLTTMVDPRDGKFPDATAVDLGELQTAYGAQQYTVAPGKTNDAFRTVVLYDTRLEKLIGFGQLAR